jgi:guanine deaminase
VCAEFGQRAFVGKVCADINSPDYYIESTEASIKDTEEFIKWTYASPWGKSAGDMCLIQPVIVLRLSHSPSCLASRD